MFKPRSRSGKARGSLDQVSMATLMFEKRPEKVFSVLPKKAFIPSLGEK